MKKILILFQSLIFLIPFLTAQDDIDYDDVIYDQNIAGVEFRLRGQFAGYPMLNMRGGSALTLSFDDFSEENRYLNYKIILCNADWTPSEEEDSYYLNGFNDNEIEDFEFSFNTRANFVNYRLHLPNDDVRIIQPGNYILYVYDSDLELPVLSRRFLVLQEKFDVNATVVTPSMVDKSRSHHEIDFEINTANQKIVNPDAELNIYVLQNWRWADAIKNLPPRFSKPGLINYDYNNKIVFPASNEFRSVDARSFEYLSPDMEHIDVFDDGYGIHMKIDPSRAYSVHYNIFDLNGDYLIQNFEEARRNSRSLFDNDAIRAGELAPTTTNQLEAEQMVEANFELDVENMRENKLRSDYCNVYFQLSAKQEVYNKDVYVVGQFSNWKPLEANRMIYDPTVQKYKGDVELKQGYYNYLYATVPKGESALDLTELEGSYFETTNEYIILVYHRGPGDRHDRLFGYRSIFSSQN